MFNFVIITLSADGLAPQGARLSTDTMMPKFIPLFISDQHLKG